MLKGKKGRYAPDKFYVYAYLNPIVPGEFQYQDIVFKYQPIYIGNGCGNRMYSHMGEVDDDNSTTNRQKIFLLRQILNAGKNPLIVKVRDNLTNKQALVLEGNLIRHFKLSFRGGSLTNLVLGIKPGKRGEEPSHILSFMRLVVGEEISRLERLRDKYTTAIVSAPTGAVAKKTIKGHEYLYLAHWKKGKVVYEYLGKRSPRINNIVKEVELRQKYQALLRGIMRDMAEIQRVNFLLSLNVETSLAQSTAKDGAS